MLLADFYLDYMKNPLEPGEVRARARSAAAGSRPGRAWLSKISKRFDSDISAVCACITLWLDGETVRDLRLSYGGMAAIVKRASKAEAALRGKPWNEANARAAMAALAEDYQPLTDMRASASYRMKVAQNLLYRAWLETRSNAPLAAAQTIVWNDMPHVLSAPVATA
jgi:xanthine dehydrogenase small subunit